MGKKKKSIFDQLYSKSFYVLSENQVGLVSCSQVGLGHFFLVPTDIIFQFLQIK